MSFGENLQYYRTANDLTQEQLAERLEVSRQSVSKWESDASFPEMEKLLTLCDLFHCSLDTLLRGDARATRQEDTAGYDLHMNRFAKQMTAGTVLCITGFAAGGIVDALTREDHWSGAVFLLFILTAVVFFIVGGIQHSDFCRQHAQIEPFYEESVLSAWRQRFPVFMATGAALCFAALILMNLFEGMSIRQLSAAQSNDLLSGLGILIIACGVGLLTYGGLQQSKYHVETYNRSRAEERDPRLRYLGNIHGAIMLSATGAFLLYWYFWRTRDYDSNQGIGFAALLIFGLGWLLCCIVSVLFKKDK